MRNQTLFYILLAISLVGVFIFTPKDSTPPPVRVVQFPQGGGIDLRVPGTMICTNGEICVPLTTNFGINPELGE